MEIDEAVIVSSSRLKSVVWNDFDRIKKGDTCVAVCRHCKKKLSGSSTSGTSHLRNHLVRCRRRSTHDVAKLLSTRGKKKELPLALTNYSYDQEQKNIETTPIVFNTQYEQGQTKDAALSIGSISFDNRRCRFDLARMIILHGYPLGMVEDIGFKFFVRNLQPLFELVTVDRVEADCKEIYRREKQKVCEELDKLPGKISLGVDLWASKGDSDYLCLTAHYIDEAWLLKKKILNFLVVDRSRAEDMLSEIIMTSLRNWDIDRKLFSVTFDNSPNNDEIVCRIRDQLSQHGFLLCSGQLFDVRCASNVITLMVQDALEALFEVIYKIRESIRYVRGSQSTQEKFNEMVQEAAIHTQKSLCLDNQFQWNSTYVMLEVALVYKNAFFLLQGRDPSYTMCPTSLEWDRASAVTSFLKLFVDVSMVFAKTKNPTANSYFPEICDVHLQLIEWCQTQDECINSLALKMKNRFDDYWKKCSLALAIAAILDPRFKMKLVEYYYPQIYGMSAQNCIDIVADCMKALYNGHAMYSPLACNGQVDNGVDAGNDKLTGFDRFLHETSQSQNVKSDLDKYLEEPLFPRNGDFILLDWWKVHTPRYPILSMMARNILGIPMSKVAAESVFDAGDKVLHHCRGSLSSETLETLMCAQDWMRIEFEDSVSSSSCVALSNCYDAS